MRDFSRLFRPRSIAVVGGGTWCRNVVSQCLEMGFEGDIWPVHPTRADIAGVLSYPEISALPDAPDAVFVGVNRAATVDMVAQWSEMGAGGAVCFASGFSEAWAEDGAASELQARLVAAAGAMPILGPNCYGYINALDRALLWPDQHGCVAVDRGVAILTQSSNIAINLTMQRRALPIAYMVTCGNMAQTAQSEIAAALLDDDRVTAIGLHIEGFGNTVAWHALALKAAERRVPLVALKVGASEQARRATVSHTASLAGDDAGAAALLRRLGIARVHDLPTFLETLKLLHCTGDLESGRLSAISCSGGEASLVADAAYGRALEFPHLTGAQTRHLRQALGPMVALSNPLDYNTYIWGDAARMTDAWSAMAAETIGLTLSVVDYPHTDAGDWACATQAAIGARAQTGRPFAVVSTLPELMPQEVASELLAGGVTPLCGLDEAIMAIEIAANPLTPAATPALPPGPERSGVVLGEDAAKALLKQHGVEIPKGIVIDHAALTKEGIGALEGPLVLKGLGFAHKSEAGAVCLNLDAGALCEAAREMAAAQYLVEEMVEGGVAELLVGVTRDPAHGFLLTLGAGGVLTELWQDTVALLLPVTAEDVDAALRRLRIWPLLAGYRGKPAAKLDAVIVAVLGVQDFVLAHVDRVGEVEINPLICTPDRAVAADALISIAPERRDEWKP
ncbi:acetate--CoA ligase family protein [Sulfitobacter sp. D35]|uniref:acetate--CoA ligase family protein n=1 Tax=Sulfitobacter sp. D35 TaxID=3083252 RepID=UPI00296F376E|nr:acetate--CoA ligase family protein [Sulfitobacter sp. D35]MDW4498208.1 acetate--CoA ligase family protein [Sulfitobacter sp. D35]